MYSQQFALQPDDTCADLIRAGLAAGDFDRIDGAFAYGTMSGVEVLTALMDGAYPGDGLSERWLLGLDWCRTEPSALAALNDRPGSSVKLVEGKVVAKTGRCVPRRPWHPKVVLLRGADAIAVVAGSGNLSRSGLTRGHEVGSLQVVAQPTGAGETALWDSCARVADWFDRRWQAASTLASVASAYETEFNKAVATDPPVVDDDVSPNKPPPWMRDPALVRKVRAARQLWIQAGNLHENRQQGLPGNQLMLSRMMRVFFGFRPRTLPTDSLIGKLDIRYGNFVRRDASLRFSNNSMDVLTLPIPGDGGPPAYDGEVLLFKEIKLDGRRAFELSIGSTSQATRWRNKSIQAEAHVVMQGGQGMRREWGVF